MAIQLQPHNSPELAEAIESILRQTGQLSGSEQNRVKLAIQAHFRSREQYPPRDLLLWVVCPNRLLDRRYDFVIELGRRLQPFL